MDSHRPLRIKIVPMLGLVLALAASAPRNAHAGPVHYYRVTDLGTLGGNNSYATAINNAGQVVGYSQTPDSNFHAFVYKPTTKTMTDLGTLGGVGSAAGDVNDAGQVLGTRLDSNHNKHTFIYDIATKTMTNLGVFGGRDDQVVGINDAGYIVGTSNDHAFVYDPTTKVMTDLGIGRTSDVNDAGLVVGNRFQPFASFEFDLATKAMTDLLGTLGAGVIATAVNNAGQIAGINYAASTFSSPFVYDPATKTTTTLDLYGAAQGINDAGYVVGDAYATRVSQGGGFLYDGSAVHDLNILTRNQWIITTASAINDSGWIVAEGYSNQHPTGYHALLLTPTSEIVPANVPSGFLPEPSSLILFGLGALGLIGERLRRRRA